MAEMHTQTSTGSDALGAVVFILYILALVGMLATIVAATMSAPESLQFVLAALSAMLGGLCFALGLWIDTQRSVQRHPRA